MKRTWEEAILRCYAEFPKGCASDQDIYRTVGRFKELKPSHMRLQAGQRPAYHNQVRSHISNLSQRGDLRIVDNDFHGLTASGWKRISV